jgi:hypothetical protein
MAEEREDAVERKDENDRETAGQTPGGVEPQTGEPGPEESQNADIPARA